MIRRALLTIAFLVLVAGVVPAAPKTSDTKVKATVSASKLDSSGKQTIEITLKIDEGWHLYANPNTEYFKDSQVVVTASAAGKRLEPTVDYPKGKLVPPKGNLPAYYTYEGTVTIKMTVDRSKGGSNAVDLNITVYACDATTCLLGGEIKLQVP